MDVLIPFADNGRDLVVTSDPLNKVRYIAKSVPFVPIPAVMAMRIQRELARNGIDAQVWATENGIAIEVFGELVFI